MLKESSHKEHEGTKNTKKK